jgi:hypothetical protein
MIRCMRPEEELVSMMSSTYRGRYMYHCHEVGEQRCVLLSLNKTKGEKVCDKATVTSVGCLF